jgi:hypothetical protein
MKEGERSEACSTHAREEDAYKDLVGKPEGKKPGGNIVSEKQNGRSRTGFILLSHY